MFNVPVDHCPSRKHTDTNTQIQTNKQTNARGGTILWLRSIMLYRQTDPQFCVFPLHYIDADSPYLIHPLTIDHCPSKLQCWDIYNNQHFACGVWVLLGVQTLDPGLDSRPKKLWGKIWLLVTDYPLNAIGVVVLDNRISIRYIHCQHTIWNRNIVCIAFCVACPVHYFQAMTLNIYSHKYSLERLLQFCPDMVKCSFKSRLITNRMYSPLCPISQ